MPRRAHNQNTARPNRRNWRVLGIVLAATLIAACSNNPYPDADQDAKVLYTSFREAPRTLDPAVAYTSTAHHITANVFDTALEYHFRKRPYELIPGLMVSVPSAQVWEDGRIAYRFTLREGIRFHADECFVRYHGQGQRTRAVVASDFAFALMRLADPAVNSPIRSSLFAINDFKSFGGRLASMRKQDESFAGLPVHEQYAMAGGIDGVLVHAAGAFEIALDQPDAQILYWFALPFTTPTAWEAVAYYDGNEGRDRFADHPVGTGPFRLAVYDKQYRFVLAANEDWYGLKSAAPGSIFPGEGEAQDIASGVIEAASVGKPLPFLKRVEFRRERESIPRFNKFLQGYYDAGDIVKESFDTVVQNDRLSPEMADLGMKLEKAAEPTVYYIGFNMDDPVVGRAGGDRSRKLRQAMSLAIDAERYLKLFTNGRGVPAQSVLPPGLFGHDAGYRNPYRQPDLERAAALLAEAGYANGIDAETGAPLKLTFDTGNTTSQAKLQYQFHINAWRKLGLDVQLAVTNYNQFQAKVRRGAYQIFTWGWIADYPDPENFLFLLESSKARSESEGPNTANFKNAAYDRLFRAMEDMSNTEERRRLIVQMLEILERERPWIELYFRENYSLSHAWLKNTKPFGLTYPTYKYVDIDPVKRADLRRGWNAPVTWPLYALALLVIVLVAPGFATFYRERQ